MYKILQSGKHEGKGKITKQQPPSAEDHMVDDNQSDPIHGYF